MSCVVCGSVTCTCRVWCVAVLRVSLVFPRDINSCEDVDSVESLRTCINRDSLACDFFIDKFLGHFNLPNWCCTLAIISWAYEAADERLKWILKLEIDPRKSCILNTPLIQVQHRKPSPLIFLLRGDGSELLAWNFIHIVLCLLFVYLWCIFL